MNHFHNRVARVIVFAAFTTALVWQLPAVAAEASFADEQLISVDAGIFRTAKALVMIPTQPKAVAVLFAGGTGALQLSGKTAMIGMGPLQFNFLIISRRHFFAQDIAIVAMESPGGHDMTPLIRLSAVGDAKAMIGQLQKTGAIQKDLPVWAIGTSAGTISAVGLAITHPEMLSGLVLTSSNTSQAGATGVWADANPRGIASMGVGKFAKPVFVMSHELDQCIYTPPGDIEFLAAQFKSSPRKKALLMKEVINPNGEPCEAISPHGFYGAEEQAVKNIVDFMLSN